MQQAVISTTFEIMKKSLKVGGENVVYFDVIICRGSHQPICVAVENASNVTMVDTDLSTFLDKCSGPECKIVHRNHASDGRILNPAAMMFSTCHYINIDDQTQSDSAQYKDEHSKAVACFVQDLQALYNRLKTIFNRQVTFLDYAKIVSVQRYFAHNHIENPLAAFLRLVREQKEKQ